MLFSKTKQTREREEERECYIVRIRSTNYIESAKKKKTT